MFTSGGLSCERGSTCAVNEASSPREQLMSHAPPRAAAGIEGEVKPHSFSKREYARAGRLEDPPAPAHLEWAIATQACGSKADGFEPRSSQPLL